MSTQKRGTSQTITLFGMRLNGQVDRKQKNQRKSAKSVSSRFSGQVLRSNLTHKGKNYRILLLAKLQKGFFRLQIIFQEKGNS